MKMIRVKSSGGKRGRLEWSENITERKRSCAKRKKEKRSDMIRAESEKISTENSGASGVV